LRLARTKADAAGAGPGEVVLAADTVVALGRRMLGKPADAAEAEAFLRLLSGRRHRVITAVAVASPARIAARAVETVVRFKRLDPDEIRAYLASGEWQGKAGGYAVQGRAAAFVPWINGSYGAIVGLPLTETLGLLQAAGLRGPLP
jgi:septum formation protein